MPKVSLTGLNDPSRRPRIIIWTVVNVMIASMVLIVMLGISSTRWFCAEGCHKVQDDTITAYNRSTHSQISCIACHLPVDADPVTFMLHKAEALGELYLTVTDTFELPLNPKNEVAKEMPDGQCRQCHSQFRVITPSQGIFIDHKVHAAKDIRCTMCHNRVAHKEDFKLELAGNRKHDDYMRMQACFRCHGVEKGAKAPGTCTACHPEDFKLKPDSHSVSGFYVAGGNSSGHWKAQQRDPGYCAMCHPKSFCTGCHGVPMPHAPDFQKTHGKLGRSAPGACKKCHAKGGVAEASGGKKVTGTEFCNNCHHKGSDPKLPWLAQHFNVVRAQGGAASCVGSCHTPTFCARCHVRSTR